MAKRSRRQHLTWTGAVAVAVLGGAAAMKGCRGTVVCGSTESAMVMYMIRGAQEAYLVEALRYLDVSASDMLYPGPGTTRMAFDNPQHPDAARWKLLDVRPDGPVRCGYTVRAGQAGDALPAGFPGAASRPARSPWYVVRAMCTCQEVKRETWMASWSQERWESARER